MTIEEFISQWDDDSESVPVYTSGSTGKPKLMMAEKKRMAASAHMTCSALHLQANDKALVCLPMDYIAGKMMVVRSLVCGLNMVCVDPSSHPLASIDSCDDIAFAAMVPMQVYSSLETEDECNKLKVIKNILIGGGAIDKELEQRLRTFPNAVWSSYGMTETLSHIALRRVNGINADDSLWYHPLPGVDVSLTDEGCLIIDAPRVCSTQLYTNDIAIIEEHDERKRFRILGRKDNVVCSGGIKIQIEEVEQKLMPCLDKPFIVSKRPSQKYGEELLLLTEDIDTLMIMDVCRKVLPHYWIPKDIVTIEKVPLTPTGKPARAEAEKIARHSIT